MDFFRMPSLSNGRVALCWALTFAILTVPFGFLTGLFVWAPEFDPIVVLKFAAMAFVLPALIEELFFRGPLLIVQARGRRVPRWAVIISLALFIAWHPFNGLLIMTDASDLFTDWRFLTVASALGAIATMIALQTRSLWLAVLFHWGVVLGWKVFLGAPDLF